MIDKTNPKINQPDHYTQGIEVRDFIVSHNLDFVRGNIIKYVVRAPLKNGLEDYLKALNYLEYLITQQQKTNEKDGK